MIMVYVVCGSMVRS